MTVTRLRRRADFLAAARGQRAGVPAFTLQARPRAAHGSGAAGSPGTLPEAARVGFTCSRKVGNAVERNRAKRRLREIARLTLPSAARPGWDYVLVGRPGTTGTYPFDAMLRDLITALARVHRGRRQ